MVWAADLAVREGDLASARRLIGMALAKLGTALSVQAAAGLIDASAASEAEAGASPPAEPNSDFAANGSVLAVASGGLLSAIDLRHSYRVLRLASHPATIRQVKVSANGRFVATFADDQSLRLFSLPTGVLVLDLPLSLDFLALGERRHAELFAFSPDSKRLLALDCGERSGPACPLLRMRVFDSERGERRSEIALPAEPVDYTSRSDGTVAVLPQGGLPRFFDADSGMEWPQPASAAAVSGKPDAARKQCLTARFESPGSRPWLISPERRWLLTLASPAQACLWDVVEHRLARTLALPRPLPGPLLLSLLADARLAVLASREPARSGGASSLASPEILSLGDSSEGRGATPISLGRGSRKPGHPLSILPLDQGGALWTVAPPRRDDASGAAERTQAVDSDGQICVLAGPSAERVPPLRCLVAPGLWQQADPRQGPLAVSGDGRFVFFGSRVPLLIEHRGRGPLLPLRLPAASDPRDDRPSENAEILDDGRLVTLDSEGSLRVYALPAGEPTYNPPEPPTLLRLRQSDGELRIERRDGSSLALSLATGLLRRIESSASPADPAAAATVLNTARGSLRIAAVGRGALTLEERKSNGLRLRLQFLPDGSGGPASERRAPAAVVVSGDGRYERIGDPALSDIEPFVICRVGPYHAPLPICGERLESKGLLAAGLALLRDAAAASPAAVPSR